MRIKLRRAHALMCCTCCLQRASVFAAEVSMRARRRDSDELEGWHADLYIATWMRCSRGARHFRDYAWGGHSLKSS